MQGWQVVTSNDEKVGKVVAVMDDYLIVEQGHFHKTRHPVPRTFAHPREHEEKVCISLPKQMVEDSPKTHGDHEFDADEVARYYGLADDENPAAEGYGDYRDNEAAWAVGRDADAARTTPNEELRAQIREGEREKAPASPGLLGGDRRRDFEHPSD
jgi:hypothetical protein